LNGWKSGERAAQTTASDAERRCEAAVLNLHVERESSSNMRHTVGLELAASTTQMSLRLTDTQTALRLAREQQINDAAKKESQLRALTKVIQEHEQKLSNQNTLLSQADEALRRVEDERNVLKAEAHNQIKSLLEERDHLLPQIETLTRQNSDLETARLSTVVENCREISKLKDEIRHLQMECRDFQEKIHEQTIMLRKSASRNDDRSPSDSRDAKCDTPDLLHFFKVKADDSHSRILHADLEMALKQKIEFESECLKISLENACLKKEMKNLEYLVSTVSDLKTQLDSSVVCIRMLNDRIEEAEEEKETFRNLLNDMNLKFGAPN